MISRLIFVFGMAIITEACYTSYAYHVARADLVKASVSSGLIAIGKAVLVIAYVREPVMVAALAMGQVCGTWLMLRVLRKAP